MKTAVRAVAAATVLVVVTLLGATPASSAPKSPTVSFHFETTLLDQPLLVDGSFTFTSLTTTTTSATIAGELNASATWDGLSASTDDTISATLTPTCDGSVATLSVDFGPFDVVFLGITYTLDPAPYTITVAADSTAGHIFCAFADVLASGGGTQAVIQRAKKSLNAA